MAVEGIVSTGATQGELDTYWNYQLYDPGTDGMDYLGFHQVHNAAITDTNWLVYKFTYSSGDLVRIEKLRGSWDGRAALSWV